MRAIWIAYGIETKRIELDFSQLFTDKFCESWS